MNTDSKKLTKEEKQEIKRIETIKANIEEATKNVNSLMSKYLNCFQIIDDEASLIAYMDACLARGGIAIDTETTGLDVYSDQLVGVCIYTSGQQEAYIPVNHVDYVTRKRLDNQLDPAFVAAQLNRLKDIKVIMHHANFDIRILRQFGVYLDCHWDTMIAANVLDENEEHGLKELYNKYILKDQKDDFNFGKLFSFKGTTFADIPINVAAVYAAHDAKMTYELYRFQVNQFKTHKYLLGAWSLFRDIEMPCVKAICDMEDTGFMFNKEYHKYLEEKYHNLLAEEEQKLTDELRKYEKDIAEWRLTPDANKKEQKKDKDGNLKFDKKGNPEYGKSKSEQLPDGDITEIKLSSPTQLAIILYDVMKLKHNSKKDGPRSTSEQALISINNDFTNMILAYRSFSKMVSAFIDSLPEQVKEDGKIHCTLKQYGAKTGRMSCSDPNLQQIPSRNGEIRQLFMAPIYNRVEESKDKVVTFKNTEEIELDSGEWIFVKDLNKGDMINNIKIIDLENNSPKIKMSLDNELTINVRERYVLIGSDYSQQEPKMLAVLSQDENMLNAAREGKDLYSAIAAKALHTTYEMCLERFPEGTPIVKKDGKWYYATEEEIKNNQYDKLADGKDDVYKEGKSRRQQAKYILLGLMYGRGPSALAEQLQCSKEEAQDIMDSVFGSFPRIKEIDVESKKFAKEEGYTTTIWGRIRRLPDIQLEQYPFDFSESYLPTERDREKFKRDTIKELQENYWKRSKKQEIIDRAYKNYKVKIRDNSGFIAQAERQVLYSRFQGSSADMTKKAIVAISKNERLKELGFNMIVPIHDEIIAQCPYANIKECKKLFTHEMSNAGSDKVDLNITVDPAISFVWDGDPVRVDDDEE